MKNLSLTITQPYTALSGSGFKGPEQPASPDPLIRYRWDNPAASDPLEIFIRRPVSAITETEGHFSNLDSALHEEMDIQVNGAGTILLDFGAEYAGWLEIDSPDLTGNITLGISEYNQPAFFMKNKETKHPNKTQAPVQYGGTYRLELNDELYEGVRFGFIHVTDFQKPFTITDVRLVCQTKPVNYNGSFHCDNEMLDKIWYTAAYDVRLNLKKDYFAAILMDRGDRFSWTGDAYPSQAAALTVFANYDFVLQNLHYTATRGNGIQSYELYWIYSLVDYYNHTGDKAGVEGLLEQALLRLDNAYNIYGRNPDLTYFGWDERLGAGFENPNTPDNQNAYKLLAIRAWNEFSNVLKDMGYDQYAEQYSRYAKEKSEELLYRPDWYKSYGLHTAADAFNTGLVTGSNADILYHKHFTNRVNRLSYSPFNQYFIMQAMAKTGNYDDAIASILDMYGGQIEYSGTAFFEVYRPQWNEVIMKNSPVPNGQVGYTSLAHPWGAGVLSWMSKELLGINPDSPGFKTFSLTPHLGRQLTRVSGEMPTPYGTIFASFNVNSGECRLTVPSGTTGRIGIPKVEKTITGVKMNGQIISASFEDDDFYYIEPLPFGEYFFEVEYAGTTPSYQWADYEYPAKLIGKDFNTAGNWYQKYGSDGYYLFNWGDTDYSNLPVYVSNIKFGKSRSVQWAKETTDPRALLMEQNGLKVRRIGAYTSDDDENCGQSFTMDIRLKQSEKKEYTAALYFVDWEKDNRQLEIEMYDGDTLNLVAPVTVLNDYRGGAYVIYRYYNSVRFRIHQMRGKNAAISGIFFGESGRPYDSIKRGYCRTII